MPFVEVGRGARLNPEPQFLNSETVIPGRKTLNHKPGTKLANHEPGTQLALIRFAEFPQVDMLGSWYEFVNFRTQVVLSKADEDRVCHSWR